MDVIVSTKFRYAGALAVGVLAAGCADPVVAPVDRTVVPTLAVTSVPQGTGRYIVEYAAGASAPSAAALRAAGGRLVDRVPHLDAVVVDQVVSAARLRRLPGVVAVMPSIQASIGPVQQVAMAPAAIGAPSGTDQSGAFFFTIGFQWGLQVIRADEVWVPTNAGLGTLVCIIDSGIDATHQELAGKVVAQRSFLPNDDGSPQDAAIDSVFHGTHVAATVTTNGLGMASVAPDAQLLVAKVFDADGAGASLDRLVNAARWCTDEGADVINMSLGFVGGINRAANAAAIAFFQAGIDYATDRGVLVVASSGNDNRQLPHATNIWLPAELDGVLNVGATGPVTAQPAGWPNVLGGTYDRKAFYSNYGTGVAVFAPGGRGNIPLFFMPRRQGSVNDAVLSACASVAITGCAGGASYIFASGTSMAAPHVAGLAAILRSELSGEPTTETGARLASCIRGSTVDIGPATTFGGGRVDAVRAVALLNSGGC